MIRLGILLSLIFFCLIFFSSCRDNPKKAITIIWRDSRAVGISIPKYLLDQQGADSVIHLLSVQLENNGGVKMLGEYSTRTDHLIFTPVIPFTRGFNYEIVFRDKLVGKINVPPVDIADSPRLIAVYPRQDTLPENLLKFYFQFSRPMREGEALQHITLFNDRDDTVKNVFLDLQPELWNTERTALTIWLDPGRIKRDLIPNRQMGNPLQKGKHYTLTVDHKWKDIQGLPLSKNFRKQFTVGARDSISPAIDNWLLDLPLAKTKDPLLIKTMEPLDFYLLHETIQILGNNGKIISGDIMIPHEGTTVTFTPHVAWEAGKYILQVAAQLEDLAGNNLNKLFDRDITIKDSAKEKARYERSFVLTSVH